MNDEKTIEEKKIDKANKKSDKKEARKIKRKYKSNMYLNVFLNITILATVGVFAWMMTNASATENIEYTGNIVVMENNVDVKLFVQQDNEYVEQLQSQSEPLIQIATLQPGSTQKYRLDVYNNIDTISTVTKIIFSEIYGDVDLLKDVVQIRCTSPNLFIFKLSDRIQYDAINDHYYFDFIDRLEIPTNDMISIYFNIYVDKNATNVIQNTNLTINKIMFINP